MEKTIRKELEQLYSFFEQKDENGVANLEKANRNRQIMRRTEETPKDKSVEIIDAAELRRERAACLAAHGERERAACLAAHEEQERAACLAAHGERERAVNASCAGGVPDAGSAPDMDNFPVGVVVEDGRLIGFGIHIFNEDVYPLKYFEISLRGCDLVGTLDVSNCRDMRFLDVYNNRISEIKSAGMPKMRIFGIQNNCLEKVDLTEMPALQGVDAGKNRLSALDVSGNPELVELYINDNHFSEIDLSHNPKLKYFYCHNNQITALDTTKNPLLRHLNATGNPMKKIVSLAPQRGERLPLEVYAGEGGCVGLRFNPVYNAHVR